MVFSARWNIIVVFTLSDSSNTVMITSKQIKEFQFIDFLRTQLLLVVPFFGLIYCSTPSAGVENLASASGKHHRVLNWWEFFCWVDITLESRQREAVMSTSYAIRYIFWSLSFSSFVFDFKLVKFGIIKNSFNMETLKSAKIAFLKKGVYQKSFIKKENNLSWINYLQL